MLDEAPAAGVDRSCRHGQRAVSVEKRRFWPIVLVDPFDQAGDADSCLVSGVPLNVVREPGFPRTAHAIGSPQRDRIGKLSAQLLAGFGFRHVVKPEDSVVWNHFNPSDAARSSAPTHRISPATCFPAPAQPTRSARFRPGTSRSCSTEDHPSFSRSLRRRTAQPSSASRARTDP